MLNVRCWFPAAVCAACEVGLTPQRRDMTFLSLEDFVCSDFDSRHGSNYYPSRDCESEDADWAAHPSSLSAPCCANATLVTASIAMMTESLALGVTEMPLDTLLSGGTDPSYSSTEYFINHHVTEDNFLLQLIVSRSQRMAGSSFHVVEGDADAPNRVQILPIYWSFNCT